MAYSVNWDTRIVSIPQADLVDLGGNVYKLDLELCHQELRRLEWEFFEGFSQAQILEYTPPTLAGGVIYAAFVLLINDYWIEFEDGQYAVNFDGANTNIQDYTVVNQVSIRPNNSAGLQDLSTLLSSAYQGRVAINIATGQSGTAVPIGTLKTPSNNIIDGVQIADDNGIGELYIIKSLTLDSGDDVSGLIVKGASPSRVAVQVNTGANVYQTEFEYLSISGILDGQSILKECLIDSLEYVNGFVINSGLNEFPVLLNATGQASFNDCWSNVAGSNTPTIDMNGTGQSLAVRNYTGGLRITNRTGTDSCSIDMTSGHVVVDATCTGDPLILRGSFKLTVEEGATEPDTTGRVMMEDSIVTGGTAPTALENATAVWEFDLSAPPEGTVYPALYPQGTEQ